MQKAGVRSPFSGDSADFAHFIQLQQVYSATLRTFIQSLWLRDINKDVVVGLSQPKSASFPSYHIVSTSGMPSLLSLNVRYLGKGVRMYRSL